MMAYDQLLSFKLGSHHRVGSCSSLFQHNIPQKGQRAMWAPAGSQVNHTPMPDTNGHRDIVPMTTATV